MHLQKADLLHTGHFINNELEAIGMVNVQKIKIAHTWQTKKKKSNHCEVGVDER